MEAGRYVRYAGDVEVAAYASTNGSAASGGSCSEVRVSLMGIAV